MGAAKAEPRFSFGHNWAAFNHSISSKHVEAAMLSLKQTVGDLHGKTFLDIGCGSGLHSLAAVRLGAKRVHSFDYDPESVECAAWMRDELEPRADWTIERGSVLDRDYLASLGKFDIVYAWGVLHHTGDLWSALDAVMVPVAERLVVSVYNDQGIESRIWRVIKRKYSQSGTAWRIAIETLAFLRIWGGHAIASLLGLRPLQPFRTWRDYTQTRGMSPWIDLRDWAGGYPFEVAKPAAIRSFCEGRGFTVEHENLSGKGRGCNEFVLRLDH